MATDDSTTAVEVHQLFLQSGSELEKGDEEMKKSHCIVFLWIFLMVGSVVVLIVGPLLPNYNIFGDEIIAKGKNPTEMGGTIDMPSMDYYSNERFIALLPHEVAPPRSPAWVGDTYWEFVTLKEVDAASTTLQDFVVVETVIEGVSATVVFYVSDTGEMLVLPCEDWEKKNRGVGCSHFPSEYLEGVYTNKAFQEGEFKLRYLEIVREEEVNFNSVTTPLQWRAKIAYSGGWLDR